MSAIAEINESLKKFANEVPAKGMHLDYLNLAVRIMDIYGDALSIIEEEGESPESEEKLKACAQKIKEIVK